jgi:hypothetical protein
MDTDQTVMINKLEMLQCDEKTKKMCLSVVAILLSSVVYEPYENNYS